MRLEIGKDAAVMMARHDHENRVAELGGLFDRMRCARFQREAREIGWILSLALYSFRDLRVVRPQQHVITAARGDDGHRGAERSRANDGEFHFLPPMRRSLPLAIRAMFAWCFTMIRMEMRMLRLIVQNGACVRNRRKSGIDAALRIDASDTKRVAMITMAKTISPAASASGSSARNAPAPVA